jgi:hypothetical protein
MSGIQLQSSLHVNRKPIPPNIQAAEQRNRLTVHHGLQAEVDRVFWLVPQEWAFKVQKGKFKGFAFGIGNPWQQMH